jgi:HD-GYP domain-containing protein (c-di-GMP phosphodiesterase class II)
LFSGETEVTLQELVEEIVANIDKYNLDDCLQDIAENINSFLGTDSCYFFLLEPHSNELSIAAAVGQGKEHGYKARIKVGEGIVGYCAEQKRTLVFSDTNGDGEHNKEMGKKEELLTSEIYKNVKLVAVVPLIAFEDLIGVIEVQKRSEGALKHDLRALQPLVNIVALAVPRRTTDESFAKLAEICIRFLEEKDEYTHGHSLRVMKYCMLIADKISMPGKDKSELRICSLLHDIGKVIIKDSLLHKKGRLTVSEYETIKMHPTIGSNITGKISHSLARKILSHHERFDGKGYPEGRKGNDIPLISRIIAIADAFDAMTSARPYREKMPVANAVGEIKRNSGTQFDPFLAKAFSELSEEGSIGIVRI